MKESLKNHYLFEYPLNELLDCFVMIFKAEKKELLRKFKKGHDADGLSFSATMYNISDMIYYKYHNDDLSFLQKAFITSIKFKEYPFCIKIKEEESINRSNENP